MGNGERLLVEPGTEETGTERRGERAPAAPACASLQARAAFFALGLALSAAGVLASWLVGRSKSAEAAHAAAGTAAIGCILNAIAVAALTASRLLSCTAALMA